MLGLLAAPGLPSEIAEELAADLPPLLAEHITDAVSWRVPIRTEPEATHLTSGVDAIDLGRERMLRHGWDLAVCVTDAPLRIERRPIVADASATHGVALISLPALGAMQTRRRARNAVIRLVDGLVGESLETGHGGAGRRVRVGGSAGRVRGTDPRGRGAGCRRRGPALRRRGRAREPSAIDRHDPRQPALAPDRAPRARLAAAAAAAVALALVTSDLWKLSNALDWIRLLALMVVSVGATVLWLIVSHRLWERPRGRASREQTVLFNVATTLTLLLGAAFLYAALFAMTLLGAALVIDSGVMAQALGHDAGIGDYAALAWMASSLGTIAGGLGAGLESDEAVREAAYGYRAERTSEHESRVPAPA